jgi:hypothetical protein
MSGSQHDLPGGMDGGLNGVEVVVDHAENISHDKSGGMLVQKVGES